MSHSRYRTLWIVGCLLFVMLVVGCTAHTNIEPQAETDLETNTIDTSPNDTLSNSTIEENIEINIDTSIKSFSIIAPQPNFHLEDCTYEMGEPIQLQLVENGALQFVEEREYLMDLATFDVQAISQNEVMVVGAQSHPEIWVATLDLETEELTKLYEKNSWFSNLRWSKSQNGFYFTGHGGELYFVHNDSPNELIQLFEDMTFDDLDLQVVDNTLRLNPSEFPEHQLLVDPTLETSPSLISNVPVGNNAIWSSDGNWVFSPNGLRSNSERHHYRTLHNLRSGESCVLRVDNPGQLSINTGLPSTIDEIFGASFSDDEHYLFFTSYLDTTTQSRQTFLIENQTNKIMPIVSASPSQHILSAHWLPNHPHIALTRIWDRLPGPNVAQLYFVDFQSHTYWKASSKYVNNGLGFPFTRMGNSGIIFQCYETQDNKNIRSLCSAKYQ